MKYRMVAPKNWSDASVEALVRTAADYVELLRANGDLDYVMEYDRMQARGVYDPRERKWSLACIRRAERLARQYVGGHTFPFQMLTDELTRRDNYARRVYARIRFIYDRTGTMESKPCVTTFDAIVKRA